MKSVEGKQTRGYFRQSAANSQLIEERRIESCFQITVLKRSLGLCIRLLEPRLDSPFYSQSTAIPHTTYSWNTTLAPVLTLPSLRSTPSCSLDGTKRPSSALHLASKPFLPQSTTEMRILYQVITSHITSLQLQASPKFHCGNDIRQPRLCRQCLYPLRRKSVRSLIRKASPNFSGEKAMML